MGKYTIFWSTLSIVQTSSKRSHSPPLILLRLETDKQTEREREREREKRRERHDETCLVVRFQERIFLFWSS
jgi:hypothetical protein